MLPDSVLSTQTIRAAFKYPRNLRRDDITDYSTGGVNFQDASQGLETNVWRGSLENGAVTLETLGVAPSVVYTDPGMTRFSFTFDQNMNVALAFDTNNSSHLWWFDTTIPGYSLVNLPAGSKYATICMDDPRRMQTGSSDIILAYIRDGVLYFRAQRERFLVEHTLESGLEGFGIRQTGLNEKLRFQFQLVRVPVDE
jgi:hypothetical protein